MISEETKKKISDSLKRKGIKPPSRKGKSPWNKGRSGIYTQETINKLKESHKGLKQSDQTIEKRISKFKGEKHWKWSGSDIGYAGLHQWVKKELGSPSKCEFCAKIAYGHSIHWANKSHEYKREKDDWIRLCVKCHSQYDRKKQ